MRCKGLATQILDRTFVNEGERWIIDYKSASVSTDLSDIDLTRKAEEYRPQLERYAALFANEGLPVRVAVFFLKLGKQIELKLPETD